MVDNEKINVALDAALDAAAPDQVSWIAGERTFENMRLCGDSIEESLYAALDAAAPDNGAWKAGYDRFQELYFTTQPGWWNKAKALFKRHEQPKEGS